MPTVDLDTFDISREVKEDSNGAYDVIDPGTYVAIIESFKRKDWRMPNEKNPNPDATDKKWDTVSLIPTFRILTDLGDDSGSRIDKQEFVLWNKDADGNPVNTSGKEGIPVWGTIRGMLFVLKSVGLKSADEDQLTRLIGLPVRIKVETGAYQPRGRSYSPAELKQLVDKPAGLRLKNVITGIYPVNAEDIAAHEDGWILDADTGIVFENQAAVDAFYNKPAKASAKTTAKPGGRKTL